MVQERREIKNSLVCTKNKLERYKTTLEQASFSIRDTDGFSFSDNSDEFTVLSVPGAMGLEKDRPFPSREELAQTLKDWRHLQRRLAELDELLSQNPMKKQQKKPKAIDCGAFWMTESTMREMLLETMREQSPKLLEKLRAQQELELFVKEQVDAAMRLQEYYKTINHDGLREQVQYILLDYPGKSQPKDPTLWDKGQNPQEAQ